jgi:hypothetical protein
MAKDKLTDKEQEVLVIAISRAIRNSLERLVDNLNDKFKDVNPPLRFEELPEYRTAVDAIKAYSKAVASELNRRYKEEK